MPLGPTEARVYECIDPLTYAPTGHPKFKTDLHAKAQGLAGETHRDFQLRCPECGSTTIRPFPASGKDAP